MANLMASTGNFTGSIWSSIDTVSFLNSESNSTATTTSFVSSSAFTPGAITTDGIGLKLLSRTFGGAGTFTVRLAQAGVAVAGTTVTVTASTFGGAFWGNFLGWAFFKFSAPVTLAAATPYTVQVQSSVAATVTVYRDATAGNWSRFLRTTAALTTVAAADYLIVCGEQTGVGTFNAVTVTMNNTAATNYSGGIEISTNGTLAYGTAASTAYQLRLSNNFLLNGGGTFTIGTSGTPIPSTSSAALEFVVGSNVQYGLLQRADSTLTTYGATKTGRAYLNADAAAAATTITTDVSTAWLSGDSIALASTTTTVAQTELLTLSGNAAGTSVPVSALGFAHSGTAPTRAEIINLTRNVKIFGQSASLQAYVSLQGTSTTSINYTEFYFLGSSTGGKRGIDMTNSIFGATAFTGCALRNFEAGSSIGMQIAGAQNATIEDCVFYKVHSININIAAATDTTVSVNNVWAMSNVLAGNSLFAIAAACTGGSITNCVGVSASGYAFSFNNSDAIPANFVASNLTGHSCNSGYVNLAMVSGLSEMPTLSNITGWRNGPGGLNLVCNGVVVDGITAFAGTTSNIRITAAGVFNTSLKNVTSNAGTSPACAIGMSVLGHCSKLVIENSSFGATTTHSTGDIDTNAARAYVAIDLRNCLLNSTTKVSTLAGMAYEGYVASSRHQQTANNFTMFRNLGTITKDNVIYNTANPASTSSTRMTPSSAAAKLRSVDKHVVVSNGKAIKITVSVRKSVVGDGTAYNGALPRLWVKKNSAIGLTTDTLLATATAASVGAFENISGTTASATDNGVFSFYVDCDGTTGWANVDEWKVEVI